MKILLLLLFDILVLTAHFDCDGHGLIAAISPEPAMLSIKGSDQFTFVGAKLIRSCQL